MATRKAAGTMKNLRDSQPKYLGLKKALRSCKSWEYSHSSKRYKILSWKNVGVGKDHTLFALKDGKLQFSQKKTSKV